MGTKEILQIKERAINLISVYPRTIVEIKNKLLAKGFAQSDINKAIKELIEKKYLDDEKYAKIWLEKRLKNRPCGRIMCKSLLTRRGISESLIDEVLSRYYSDEQELKIGKAIIEKKIGPAAAEGQPLAFNHKKKLVRFLNNRGFSMGTIMEIIK